MLWFLLTDSPFTCVMPPFGSGKANTSWLYSIQLTSWHVHIYLDLDQNLLEGLKDPKCYGWRENGCTREVTFREVPDSVYPHQLCQVYQISFSSWCRRLNWAWKWPVRNSPRGRNLLAVTDAVSACCSVSTPPSWEQFVGKGWGLEKRISLIFMWHWGYHDLAQKSLRQDCSEMLCFLVFIVRRETLTQSTSGSIFYRWQKLLGRPGCRQLTCLCYSRVQ